MAEHHHSYTALLILIFTLLVLAGAIFFTIAQVKVTSIAEYKAGNSKLNTAKNDLIVAYILGYIAVGVGLVLSILYFGHVAWGIQNEWPHLIIFFLLFILVILSGIFGFLALSNINSSGAENKNSSQGWIWAAQVAGLLGLIFLVISGGWRASYVSNRSAKVKTDSSLTVTASPEYMYERNAEVFQSPAPISPPSSI